MQEEVKITTITTEQDEKAALRKLILDIRYWTNYLLSKWYIILLIAGVGAAAGFAYAASQKKQYIATTSFVLETGAKNGASAYAGIASAFGVNLGGGGGGLFEGENILELYKSRRMITEALLTEVEFNGKKQLLVDRYVEFKGLREQLENNPQLKNLRFRADNQYSGYELQLAYNGLLANIVADINSNYLKVDKKDKKLNILEIIVTSPDELFSKKFNEQIVATVNDFYLTTKMQKGLDNVAMLQAKTDSVRAALRGAISRGAAVEDATPNQNPTRMAQKIVPAQSARVNAEISQGALAQLIQNLEMSKISLQKEAPLIQIVDTPILPLNQGGRGELKWMLIGGFGAFLLIVGFLILKRIVKDALK